MKKITLALAAVISIQAAHAQKDSAQFYYNSGKTKTEGRLYNAASKDFDKAIQFDASYTAAYIANGNVNIEMNRLYVATKYFNKAHELEPANVDVIKQLLTLSFNARQHSKTIELASKCKDCEGVDRMLGMTYYRMEDYGKAVTFLLKALKTNDKDGEAAYTLARTYLELEKYKEAIAYYEKATAFQPEKSSWSYELALLYYNQNNYKSALKCFNAAISNGYKQNNDFLENLGFCYLYTGEIDSAMKALNTVMERKPNNTVLLNDIAYAMYSTKRYEGAISFYEKLLTINPNDASSLYMAGMTFQKMGQKEKGQAICDKAIEMDPSLAKNRQKKEMPFGL